MLKMKEEYIQKIYAGWLAKIIGIRLGASIEGWTYDKIKNSYGELTYYPRAFKRFAADDDSNGPLFFLRALEGKNENMTAQDVGEALLNYAPYEHGFFWWGGYGTSTEHTAYLNLRNGIQAPRSGSIEQNGKAVAEQIGGQIFIDTWGLVSPGNPDLAAKLAEKAASVTHDGNGIYGGIFIAVCISYSFIETDIEKIINKGLSYIPEDCEYSRIVKAVIRFYKDNPQNWRDCFQYIYDNYGYDKYPGNCHIIPNSAVMVLSLLYGEGDFSNTLNICNMCGWDTDCNVGNIATIMGVRNGLESIDASWREPINDLLVCSSVLGCLNIMDIPYGANYISKLAYDLSNDKPSDFWEGIFANKIMSCHFEFPGSTHALEATVDTYDMRAKKDLDYKLINSSEFAATGQRSLKVIANRVLSGETVRVYKKTYYTPSDFSDSRYDPSFSPIAYPGQKVYGAIYVPDSTKIKSVALYAKDKRSNKILSGKKTEVEKSKWMYLQFDIPSLEGGLIEEVGFSVTAEGGQKDIEDLVFYIDDLHVDNDPDYSIDFSKENYETWTPIRKEISQFTKLKGLVYLENELLHMSCSDFAEIYTGDISWKNYCVTAYITPITGKDHFINFRVQGAIRSYAFGLNDENKIVLLKNEHGYKKIAEADYSWQHNEEVKLSAVVDGLSYKILINDKEIFEYSDNNKPYLSGCIGLSVLNGSHLSCRSIEVRKL